MNFLSLVFIIFVRMRDPRGTYKIDTRNIIEYRVTARLLVAAIFFGMFILFLIVSMNREDADTSVAITIYMFSGIFLLIIFVCLVMPTPSEGTVIVIDDQSIKKLIDGVVTTTIAIHEIGAIKDINNGFLIIKRHHQPVFRRTINYDHFDVPYIIYVPRIILGYQNIYEFVKTSIKTNNPQ